MTIEHLKYGNCGPGNEFNLIKIKFKDHMWLVAHVSLNADREIIRFYLDHPPPPFLPAGFIKCLCGGNIFFKALELSSSIGFFQDWGGSDSPAEGLTDPSAH